uniref:Uncharacterized protein n=1 Tax=Arundo donax TaxID=35708 RepID=A0A0A9GUE5_ARUDO
MSRRLVNLMVQNSIGRRSAFNLHRINPWRCFYPTRAQALEAASAANNKTIMEDARLPRAAISFYRPCPPGDFGDMNFMSLGCSSNDIISMDQDGNTLLYEAASRAIRVMPVPHAPKLSPVSLAAGDSLYLLDGNPGPQEDHPFEALTYRASCSQEEWYYWRSLPPPPFAFDYEYREVEEEHICRYQNPCVIEAYTAVGDSQIWISTVGAGTYSFDARSGVWSKAGEWALPFDGSVEYAPELGLWFGFSSQGGRFAASDLGTASATSPPVLQKVWDELAAPLPRRWVPVMAYLLPLGSGKFCIARVVEMAEEGWCREKEGNDYLSVGSFAVFTGVEVERGSRGALRMIKHKSRRYSLGHRMVQILL